MFYFTYKFNTPTTKTFSNGVLLSHLHLWVHWATEAYRGLWGCEDTIMDFLPPLWLLLWCLRYAFLRWPAAGEWSPANSSNYASFPFRSSLGHLDGSARAVVYPPSPPGRLHASSRSFAIHDFLHLRRESKRRIATAVTRGQVSGWRGSPRLLSAVSISLIALTRRRGKWSMCLCRAAVVFLMSWLWIAIILLWPFGTAMVIVSLSLFICLRIRA